MNIMLNIFVLVLEIVYYSLFMLFAKKQGNLKQYVITFTLATLSVLLFNDFKLITYVSFIFVSMYCIKYVFKIKSNVYDILFMIIMLLFKLIVEFAFTMCIYLLFKSIYNVYLGAIIVSIIKILIVIIFKPKLALFYMKLKKLWDNNNFYIRYITSLLMMIYLIAICILLIVKLI